MLFTTRTHAHTHIAAKLIDKKKIGLYKYFVYYLLKNIIIKLCHFFCGMCILTKAVTVA